MRLLHLDPGPCSVCGASENAMHLHHIVPRSRGGHDSRENLCWLCPDHHRDLHAYRLTDAQLSSIRAITPA
jgi:5-methylcytosine-specific restriction endonuclease McrA